MGRTGAIAAAEAFQQLGISHLFGNPGTTELPFIQAIEAVDGITYVSCLHEDVAMGAAAGFAIRSRQLRHDHPGIVPLGVANVHTTPGIAHAMGNIHGSMFAHAPVLITAGSQAPRHERRRPPLSGNRAAMVDSLVQDAIIVETADAVSAATMGAARTAMRPPMGPVYLEYPMPVQEASTDATIPALGPIPTQGDPGTSDIRHLVDRIRDADVTIVVGDELGRAGPEAIDAATRLAERLQAPVYAEPLFGELGFPTDHPQWIGQLPVEADWIREAISGDVLLCVGCTTIEPLLDYEPPLWPPDMTACWLGASASHLPPMATYDVVVTGHLPTGLQSVLHALEPAVLTDGKGVSSERRAHIERITTATERQTQQELDGKIRLVEALSTVTRDAIVIDEGVTTGFLLRDLGALTPGQFIGQHSGGLGFGLPAAVGAAIAEGAHTADSQPVIALIGDGSYQYYPQAIYTAAQYVESPLTVVIPDNSGYGILRDRGVLEDDSRRTLSFDSDMDIQANAASYGVPSRRVSVDDNLERILEDAVNRGGPDVVVVDL